MGRAGIDAARVVAEALDLADEMGFEAITVSEVARRLGVRVPSLYAHVGGLDDLKIRMATAVLDELADRALSAIAGRAGAEALVAYADTVRTYARSHPGGYAAAHHPIKGESEACQAAVAAGRRNADAVAAILRGYGLTGTDAVHATRLIGSVIHGFISLEAADSFSHSRPSSAASWSKIIVDLAKTVRTR